MNVDTSAVEALTEQVSVLSAEVSRLSEIREALDGYASWQAAAHHLIELGRCEEREEQARQHPSRRRRNQQHESGSRPGHLRVIRGKP